MPTLETLKQQILHLYQTAPHIHMNVTLLRPKLVLENAEATITGVYPHIFQIEENTSGSPKRHSLPYTDVLIRHIVILELEKDKA